MAVSNRPAPFSGGVLIRDKWIPEDLAVKLRSFKPKSEMGLYIRECLAYLPAHMAAELVARVSRTVVLESSLSLKAFRDSRFYAANGGRQIKEFGRVEDYGIVSRRLITDVGVAYLVDAWQNIVELENQKFHGLGTGFTAENQTDTALVTELTTEYTGNVRATGSLTEGATANIFRSVGTNTLDGTPGAALREHGLFSASTVGVLWDRSVYAAITLSSGEALQSTYDMTASAGG